MAIAGPLGLIVGLGAVLGAATSQVIPTRLVDGGSRPWGAINPERYPEIVAVTYDSASGVYFAPKAYTAVSPVIPMGPWDSLPGDNYEPVTFADEHLADVTAYAAPVNSDNMKYAQDAEQAEEPVADTSAAQPATDVPDDVVTQSGEAGA